MVAAPRFAAMSSSWLQSARESRPGADYSLAELPVVVNNRLQVHGRERLEQAPLLFGQRLEDARRRLARHLGPPLPLEVHQPLDRALEAARRQELRAQRALVKRDAAEL